MRVTTIIGATLFGRALFVLFIIYGFSLFSYVSHHSYLFFLCFSCFYLKRQIKNYRKKNTPLNISPWWPAETINSRKFLKVLFYFILALSETCLAEHSILCDL